MKKTISINRSYLGDSVFLWGIEQCVEVKRSATKLDFPDGINMSACQAVITLSAKCFLGASDSGSDNKCVVTLSKVVPMPLGQERHVMSWQGAQAHAAARYARQSMLETMDVTYGALCVEVAKRPMLPDNNYLHRDFRSMMGQMEISTPLTHFDDYTAVVELNVVSWRYDVYVGIYNKGMRLMVTNL